MTEEKASASHEHRHHHVHGVSSNLRVAFVLNLVFALIELGGGLWTNSMAILSDAMHDFGDSLAIGLALLLENLSHKKRDDDFTYGYRRFSTLSAVMISMILLIGSVLILYHGIPRIIQPVEVQSGGMFILSIIGLTVNGYAVLRMSGQHGSLNQKAVRLHLLEDVIGWLIVVIGSLVIYFTDFYFIDPLLSIGLALWIGWNSVRNMRSSLLILLQASPKDLAPDELKKAIELIDGIDDVHGIYTWSLDGEHNIATLHVCVSRNMQMTEIKEIKRQIRQKVESLPLSHLTIEFELREEACEHIVDQ